MRRLRESFEYLTRLSNQQNDLINRGKFPLGFQLLEAKDSTRAEIDEDKNKVAVHEKKSLLGYLGIK